MKTTDFLCEKHLSEFLVMFIFCDIHSTLDTVSPILLSFTIAHPGVKLPGWVSHLPLMLPQRQCLRIRDNVMLKHEGLGGPCVHVIVTDTQPSLFSLMHRNLSGKVRTTESISEVQLLLWETLFFLRYSN